MEFSQNITVCIARNRLYIYEQYEKKAESDVLQTTKTLNWFWKWSKEIQPTKEIKFQEKWKR